MTGTGMLHWSQATTTHDETLGCVLVDVPLTSEAPPQSLPEWLPRVVEAVAARFGTTYSLLAIGHAGGHDYHALFTVHTDAEA